MSLNIADTSGTQLIVRVGNKGSSRVSGWTSFDSTSGSGSGLFVSNFENTSLTTTNLQLNGSSLNTILTGITAPSNLIATNLTTTNAVINSFSRHLKIDGGLTGLPAQTNFQLYITGNEGSPNVGSLYVGDGTGFGFNFKRRVSSTDTVLGRINDNGDFWITNEISCANLRTSNLTTTNLQLNGSSLNTILTNTFTSINNLSTLTSANVSNISSSNICSGNIFTTNQTVLNNLIINGNVGIGTSNTVGVSLNVNNQSGTCRVRASGPYSAQQGLGLFDTTNNTERWIIYREGNSDNLRIWNGSSNVFDMAPSGNLGLIGSLSCGNLRASAITCSNLTVSSGNTRLDFVVGNRGSSPVDGWTSLDPNGGSNQGLFIWDGLEVSGGITGSNLQILNTINSSVISSGSLFSTNLTNLFNTFNSPVNISNGVGVTFGCNSIINFNDGNPASTSLTLGTARQLIEGLQSSGITWNMYSSITAILYNAGSGGLTIRNSTDIIRTSTTLANIGVGNFIRLNLLRVPDTFGIGSSTTWGSILINTQII